MVEQRVALQGRTSSLWPTPYVCGCGSLRGDRRLRGLLGRLSKDERKLASNARDGALI